MLDLNALRMDGIPLAWNYPDVRTWADVVQLLMEKTGWSGLELNRKAGLNKGYTSMILKGKVKRPRLDSQVKLAKAVGMTVEQLRQLREETPPPAAGRIVPADEAGGAGIPLLHTRHPATLSATPASPGSLERDREVAMPERLKATWHHLVYLTIRFTANQDAICDAVDAVLKRIEDNGGVVASPKARRHSGGGR